MDRTTQGAKSDEGLGFQKAVTAAFEYLEKEFGFRVDSCDESSVTYLSSQVKIVVEIESFSYQIDVWIGPLLKDGYSLDEIIGSQRTDQMRPRGSAQSSTRSGVWDSVHNLAALVRQYAGPTITGDSSAYREYASYRRRREYDRTDQAMNSATRSAAEEAWQQKDFEHVIELYQSVQGSLRANEERRLRYARRKVAAQNE